jgi:hypothetical protein
MGSVDFGEGVVASGGFFNMAIACAGQCLAELGAAGGVFVSNEYAGVVVFHVCCILLKW